MDLEPAGLVAHEVRTQSLFFGSGLVLGVSWARKLCT